MSLFEQNCFNCGEPGHFAGQCPKRRAKNSGDRNYQAPPPEPPRKKANEIADPALWAAKIRELHGWSKGQGNRRSLTDLETLAREQVAKARYGRGESVAYGDLQ